MAGRERPCANGVADESTRVGETRRITGDSFDLAALADGMQWLSRDRQDARRFAHDPAAASQSGLAHC
jgi:hypothetical protein